MTEKTEINEIGKCDVWFITTVDDDDKVISSSIINDRHYKFIKQQKNENFVKFLQELKKGQQKWLTYQIIKINNKIKELGGDSN